MRQLKGVAVLAVILAFFCALGFAQANNGRNATIYVQALEPPSVDVGYFWFDTGASSLKIVTGTSPTTWSTLGSGGGGGGLPSGSVVLVTSGSCPAGTTELSALDGKTLVGTLAANGNVGTTGGADTITPAGTVAAPVFTGTQASLTHTGANVTSTFTGSALATHQHELPFQIVSGTSFRAISAATFGTGTSRAAIGGGTMTANTTSAAVAKDQAVSAGTPAGTVANTITQANAHTYTPQGTNGAPAFTGTQFDNRSAFARVIFCQAS